MAEISRPYNIERKIYLKWEETGYSSEKLLAQAPYFSGPDDCKTHFKGITPHPLRFEYEGTWYCAWCFSKCAGRDI